jgi:hypothetical protein
MWKLPCCVSYISEGVTCFGPYWPQVLASPKMGTSLYFLQKVQFRFPPALYAIFHIQIDEKKDKTQLKRFHKNYLCVKNALYPSPYTDIIWYFYISSYF